MKRTLHRIAAAALAAVLVLPLCGCADKGGGGTSSGSSGSSQTSAAVSSQTQSSAPSSGASGKTSSQSPSSSAASSSSAAAPKETGAAGVWIAVGKDTGGDEVLFDSYTRSLYLTLEEGGAWRMDSILYGTDGGAWEKTDKGASMSPAGKKRGYTLTLPVGESFARFSGGDLDDFLMVRTDTPEGASALRFYERAVSDTTGTNEDTVSVFTALAYPGEDEGSENQFSVKLDPVLRIRKDDAGALSLYGIKPSEIAGEYASVNTERYVFEVWASYAIGACSLDGTDGATGQELYDALAARSPVFGEVETYGETLLRATELTEPEPGAAPFCGMWVSYGTADANGKKTLYDDYNDSCIYRVYPDGTWTAEGIESYCRLSGSWTPGADSLDLAVIYDAGRYDAPDGKEPALSMTEKGGTMLLRNLDDGTASLLAGTADEALAGVLEMRNGYKENVGFTTDYTHACTAYITLAGGGDGTEIEVNPVLWMDGSDTEALKLYGFTPGDVTDDHEIADTSPAAMRLELPADAEYEIIFPGASTQPVPQEAKRSDLADKLKRAGSILAEVSYTGGSAVRVSEIYQP